MLQVTAGSLECLTVLVERYHSHLLGYLYRLVGSNRPLAEDLVQETFVKVIQSANKQLYEPGRQFRPWLYAIATNLAHDYFKSAQARHESKLSSETDIEQMRGIDDPDTAGQPEPSAIRSEQARQIATAIATLPTQYRAAILLRFYGGMSLQEIADALEIPVGTVKSRLSVGCSRLRDALGPSDSSRRSAANITTREDTAETREDWAQPGEQSLPRIQALELE